MYTADNGHPRKVVPSKPHSVHKHKWHQDTIPLARSVLRWSQDFPDTRPAARQKNRNDCASSSCMSVIVLKLPNDLSSVTNTVWPNEYVRHYSVSKMCCSPKNYDFSHFACRVKTEVPIRISEFLLLFRTTPWQSDNILSTAQIREAEYFNIRS
jgi:hypothetical protein